MIFTDGVHLISDCGLDELHAFARSINLHRCWFHRDHYDMTSPDKAERAVRAGALLVGPKDVVLVRRSLRLGSPLAAPRLICPASEVDLLAETARAEHTRLLRTFAPARRRSKHAF